MPQIPGTGTPEQVTRMLALLARSSAYPAEVQSYIANLTPGIGALKYTITDINGGLHILDLSEKEFNDTSWVHTQYAHGQITARLQVVGPFPMIEIIQQSSNLAMTREGQPFEFYGGHSTRFLIDAVTICQQDEPQAAQREAIIMASAFERLVMRNPALGGLVETIRVTVPVEAGGGGVFRDVGLVMAARTRFEVVTLTIT